jgi:hypothetical protein
MPALVSLEDGLRHLNELTSPIEEMEDMDVAILVQSKIDQASDVVLDYLKYPEDSVYWDDETTPEAVKAAVLLVLSDLYEHRAGSDKDDVVLSVTVKDLLRRRRDPTLA